MSLSSALFSGISGLNTLGNAMTVIGDNIANVNTTGFKSSRATFQDVLSQTVSTTAGSSQVGRGTSLADIASTFAQGSFASTDSATDLAIGGEGFFVVREPNNTNNEFYTRAGEFRFDRDGNFTTPAGYIVRGWALDPDTGATQGSVGDIMLSSFTSSPSETDELTVITNLNSGSTNNSSGSNTSLSEQWDGNLTTPLGDSNYDYQSTLKVYDSLGDTNDITMYFDRGESTGVWEYVVTCNPSDDERSIFDASSDGGYGMLGRGTITFSSSSGAMQDITFSRFVGNTNGGDPDDMTAAACWDTQSTASDLTNGHFTCTPLFITGGTAMTIELDLGAAHDGTSWANNSLSTSQFASSSTTIFQSANGYGAGDLQSVSVGTDGAITGQYSNGEVIPLYQVALAKFQNQNGLYKVGGNLFKETRISGVPITGTAGANGLGNISSNSLEQSNVDIATEFVKMITTQRGFQANSKIITVTDQMLAEVIALKR
ncbi:MAG: hypothetical protein BBJ60_09910 [Desulfobacterales bacterium S7086C20]|nr:MAG: hypothetical protein BBJ60_09910 [Desulfobacterales bacterium S7086C20]